MTTNKETKITIQFTFEKDPVFGWSVFTSLQNGSVGMRPLSNLPFDQLCLIRHQLKEDMVCDQQVKKEILEVINHLRTLSTNKSLEEAQYLGAGEVLMDGVVHKYFPTVNLSPEVLPEEETVEIENINIGEVLEAIPPEKALAINDALKKTISQKAHELYEDYRKKLLSAPVMDAGEAATFAASLMHRAVAGEIKVTLKDPNNKFEYMKEDVIFMFGLVEMVFYIEGFGGDPDSEDICDGNLRYLSTMTFPDGKVYEYGESMNDALGCYEHEDGRLDPTFAKLKAITEILEAAV